MENKSIFTQYKLIISQKTLKISIKKYTRTCVLSNSKHGKEPKEA